MHYPQANRFKRYVLPIILKQTQKRKLLQNYFKDFLIKRNQQALQQIKTMFTRYDTVIKQEQQEIIQEKDESKGALSTLLKITRTYNTVRKLILLFKGYKIISQKIFQGNSANKFKWWENQAYRKTQHDKLYRVVNDQKGLLQESITGFLTPVLVKFRNQIRQKLQPIWGTIVLSVVEKIVLFDPEDPIDIALWAVSVAATAASAIITYGSFGLGAGAGAALMAAAWAPRIAKAMKIFKSIGKFGKLGGKIMTGVKAARRGLTTANRFLTTTRKGAWASAGLWALKNAKSGYRISQGLIGQGVSMMLFGVNEKDVNQMIANYRTQTSRYGEKYIEQLNGKMGDLINDLNEVEIGFRQMGKDMVQGLRSLSYSKGFVRPIQKLYGITIRFKGWDSLAHVKVLHNLSERIRKELPKLLQKQKIDYDLSKGINVIFDSTKKKWVKGGSGQFYMKKNSNKEFFYKTPKQKFTFENGQIIRQKIEGLFELNGKKYKTLTHGGFSVIFRNELLDDIKIDCSDPRHWFSQIKKHATQEQLNQFKKKQHETIGVQMQGVSDTYINGAGKVAQVWQDKEYYIVAQNGLFHEGGKEYQYNALMQDNARWFVAYILKNRGLLSEQQYNNIVTKREHDISKYVQSHEDDYQLARQRRFFGNGSVLYSSIEHLYAYGMPAGVWYKFPDHIRVNEVKFQGWLTKNNSKTALSTAQISNIIAKNIDNVVDENYNTNTVGIYAIRLIDIDAIATNLATVSDTKMKIVQKQAQFLKTTKKIQSATKDIQKKITKQDER